MTEKKHFIMAPHPDDEIIGCYEIIKEISNNVIVMYFPETETKRKEEALRLRDYHSNVSAILFQNSLPPMVLQDKNFTFYFPDPVNEIHPIHRAYGAVGEGLAREGKDVVFYTTLMNVPYIHEVTVSGKDELLNKLYPSQKSLWEYEKKYILFEGRCKWMF